MEFDTQGNTNPSCPSCCRFYQPVIPALWVLPSQQIWNSKITSKQR